jgi:hypothetical protein
MNRVSSSYAGGHTQWDHKFARQVKDSYILLTGELHSRTQGFAVHGILYTLL